MAATTAPSREEQGRTAKSFKQLRKNKRRKIEHQKFRDTEGLGAMLPVLNDRSTENVATVQTPSDQDNQLIRKQDAPDTSAGRTWALSELVGGRYIPADPVISRDEKHLILAQAHAVKVFSIETSLMLRKMNTSESESVSAYALSTAVSSQLYAATSAGTIYLWDFISGASIAVYNVSPCIIQLCVCPLESDGGPRDVLLALHSPESKSSSLKAYKTPKKSHRGSLEVRDIFKFNVKPRFFNAASDGKVLAVAADKFLTIGLAERLNVDTFNSLTYFWRQIPSSESIRSLDLRVRPPPSKKKSSFSPSNFGLDIVLGCETGVVMLFENVLNNLLQQEKLDSGISGSLAPRTLHWHFEAVNAVRWSADGNYIISGGPDRVIVLWQLDTGKQQFLPHLSASIERLILSSSGNLYVIHLGDNSVMVLSTNDLKPVTNISGIQARTLEASSPGSPQESTTTSSATISLSSIIPSTVCLSNPTQLLLAVPASQWPQRGYDFARATFLQTYDISSDQHLARQALTRTNTTNFKVNPEGAQIMEPDVKHIVASPDGRWLASVDEWEQSDQDLRPLDFNAAEHRKFSGSASEHFLKIWSSNGNSMEWSLVTRIDKPHASRDKKAARVLDIISHPRSSSFVSLGDDGSVRTWAPKPRRRDGIPVKDRSGKTLVSWACVQTVWLATHASVDLNITGAASLAYCADGSVLAVSWRTAKDYDGTVYFIDPLSGEVAFVRNGLYAKGLVKLGFVGRYLIVLSNHLRIYDMVNDKLQFLTSIKSEGQTPKEGFLTRSLTKLSIHPKNETFAIAIPIIVPTQESASSKEESSLRSEIAVFAPESPQPLFTMISTQPVTSLVAVPAGFAIIDAILNLRVISPRGEIAFQPSSRSEQSPGNQHWIENAYGASGAETRAHNDGQVRQWGLQEPADHESLELRGATSGTSEESASDRVNRRQLADLFDAAPSYALPPVSKLFEGVAGLVLGRRENETRM